MKWHSVTRTKTALLCGAAIAMGMAAGRAQASEWDKRTIVTVNEKIQVKDTVLEPGKYIFKVMDSNSDRHIVQIFNSDQSRLINTIMAIPNYRQDVTGETKFTFWETPAGKAKAMRAWFYPGDNYGQEFTYPKNLASVVETASATMTTPVVPQPEVVQPTTVQPTEPTKTDDAEPIVEPTPTVPDPPDQPVVDDQTPATDATQPAAQPQQPDTMPKTNSLYPLAGMTGLVSLGLFGVVRRKRSRA